VTAPTGADLVAPGATGAAEAPGLPAGRRAFLDRGAIVAGYVGIGMAATIAVSFLLVIPIEPIYWLLTPFAGLLIGYYADQRSFVGRGEWRRTLVGAIYAGLVTGVTLALLLLMVKALFFSADNGYRDGSLGSPLQCAGGADCVYTRYLADGRGPQLEAAGVTDVASFSAFYWQQQLTNAGILFGLTVITGALGGAVYGVTRPKDG
jgi:hypothetical protein